MKKLLGLSFLICLSSMSAGASARWTIQEKDYQVDTLFHAYVGPGTTQTNLKLSGAGNQRIFYTTTDLTNPYVEVRAIKGKDTTRGLETISSMAESRTKNSSTNYFSGVNADFFSMSAPTFPIGQVLVDGEPYYTNNADTWASIGISKSKQLYSGTSTINAVLTNATAGSFTITGFNNRRYTNSLILFSSKFGTATETNEYGSEVVLETVDNVPFTLLKAMQFKVVAAPVSSVGNMTIPEGKFVLSGNGTAADYVNSLKAGDIIDMTPKITFNGANVDEMSTILGGQPMILSNGEVLETQGVIDHLSSLNPRTAVGYSADGKKLIMLVVDGRSTLSSGVISKQLAEIMRYVGCSEAMNFDGGGSSELYSRYFGVNNQVSDGNERSVADGLLATTDAPEDNNISILRFKDTSVSLPKYGYYSPVLYGYNKYGVLINTNVTGYTLSATNELGEIINDGKALFCTGEGMHALTATFNGVTATVPLTVSQGDVSFRLSEVIEDGYRGYVTEVNSTIGEDTYLLDNRALTWSSENPEIASVEDVTGKILGHKDGETTVYGQLGDYVGSIKVKVEIPENKVMPVESNIDASTWAFTQSGGTIKSVERLDKGIAITYEGKSSRNPNIKMSKAVKLWSIPDAFQIRVNPNGSIINNFTFSMKLANGKTTVTQFVPESINKNEENVLSYPMSKWCDVNDRAIYPITLNSITIGMGASITGTEYKILMPGIELLYNDVPAGNELIVADKSKSILYPNPVKAGESVTISGLDEEGDIRIYDEYGKLVKTVNYKSNSGFYSLSTSELYKGLYIVYNGHFSNKLIIK